mgnify:FL=1
MKPEPPLDWVPQVFRSMLYTDEQGQRYRLDYSVPGGRWVPCETAQVEQSVPLSTGESK